MSSTSTGTTGTTGTASEAPAVETVESPTGTSRSTVLDQGTTDVPTGTTIASLRTYAEAQRVVDHLSESGFEVGALSIVGTDLRLVEDVVARFTLGRSVVAGLALGGWFGAFVGIALAALNPDVLLLNALLLTIGLGLVFGLVAGAFKHATARGHRDFTSVTRVASTSWNVICDPEHADEALRLASTLAGAEVDRTKGPSAARPGARH